MTTKPLIFENVCDDPYWDGCTNKPAMYREKVWSDTPDTPECLCQDCYDQMIRDGHIKPSEWQRLGEYYTVSTGDSA